MRARAVDKALRSGPLTAGQKEAVKLILSSEDRTVGVQGYAGSGKTTMLTASAGPATMPVSGLSTAAPRRSRRCAMAG